MQRYGNYYIEMLDDDITRADYYRDGSYVLLSGERGDAARATRDEVNAAVRHIDEGRGPGWVAAFYVFVTDSHVVFDGGEAFTYRVKLTHDQVRRVARSMESLSG